MQTPSEEEETEKRKVLINIFNIFFLACMSNRFLLTAQNSLKLMSLFVMSVTLSVAKFPFAC